MIRKYAKPGDIVDCPLVRKPVTIEKIYSQDYYGPAKDDGWQIEFEDTTGEYRAWKQRWDGGKLLMLGTKENPYVDYKTRKELLKLISDAAAQDDPDQIQIWNDILDVLVTATWDREDKDDWVVTVCHECMEWCACLLEELLDSTEWFCDSCDADMRRWLNDVDPEADDLEAERRLDADCDDDYEDDYEDDDDYWEDDDDDYAQNMPCDNTGYCAGDACRGYYNCQVHHADKE